MLFSSLPFLFYFLPAVLLTYFLVPGRFKNAVLLLSSLFFYGWGEPKYVLLMMATIALFYICGLAIEKAKTNARKRAWLIVSVVVSLGLLAIFISFKESGTIVVVILTIIVLSFIIYYFNAHIKNKNDKE